MINKLNSVSMTELRREHSCQPIFDNMRQKDVQVYFKKYIPKVHKTSGDKLNYLA